MKDMYDAFLYKRITLQFNLQKEIWFIGDTIVWKYRITLCHKCKKGYENFS